MKITDIITEKQVKGTYAGVKFSSATKEAIKDYCSKNDIPNAVSGEKLHTTLLYSRKFLPNYEPLGEYEEVLVGKPTVFDVWDSQPKENSDKTTRCLVLKYSCKELTARHKELMKEHEATFDYPYYNTHVTLSYDIGDLDIVNLPKFTSDIEIVSEYGNELDLNWTDKE